MEKMLSQEMVHASLPDDKLGKDIQSDLAPNRWSQRMKVVLQKCNFSGKERKTC